MNKLIFPFLLFIIFSCKKEEIPVKKHTPGNAVINSFEMGSDYRKQAFYDLKTNTFVRQNLKTSWDLGFENGTNGSRIVLNSANAMAVARVSNINFNTITDTIGLAWHWDASSGNLDSTAIKSWWIDDYVYVINRGTDQFGNHRGFAKLKFDNVTSNTYSFKVANLDGTLEEQITIQKDNSVNLTTFSLTTRSVEDIQPPKTDWDLMFTQYVHYFEFFLGVQDEAYLVTGILTNRSGVQVAEVFNKEFESINIDDISAVDFSSNIDIIGYDWKEFGFSTGVFIIHSDKNYIIKSTEGIYFKLHFIDFYNSQGDKGTPVFELQEL